MNDFSDHAPNSASARWPRRRRLTVLLCLHIVICCASLIFVAKHYAGYHVVWFDEARLLWAVLGVAPFAVALVLFLFAQFSFGYFLGFYFYSLILGYLWLAAFSQFHYDHTLASVSALVSGLAFLGPALFVTSPIRQRLVLTERMFDHLLSFIMVVAAAIVAAGVFYNFRLVGIADIYVFRDKIEVPALLRYATGATSNALLPYAFACFAIRGHRWRAAAALVLLLLFYPITLTKMALYAPFWLVYLALLLRFFEARTTVVLSLLVPTSAGVILALLQKYVALPYEPFLSYFGSVNFRMIALPSIVLDVYGDFFSRHPLTYFCQITMLKPFVGCPYSDQLSIVMANAYQFGNINASLFATEGIASVGPVLAPLAALACGLVISLANRLSHGLPPPLILLSGGVLTEVFLNVPLATTLLSNGAALLFLLWYVTPRTVFGKRSGEQAAPAH